MTKRKQIHDVLDENGGEIAGTEHFSELVGLGGNKYRLRQIVREDGTILVIPPQINGRGHKTLYRKNLNLLGLFKRKAKP